MSHNITKLNTDYVTTLFLPLIKGDYETFFKSVADNVNWRVMGTHPLAGIYQRKEDFLNSTFRRLNKLLREGTLLKLVSILVDNNVAVVELQALSTQNNGQPFNNELCWILTFDSNLIITSAKAYLDSNLVKSAIENN